MLQQLSDEAKITSGTLSGVALKLAEYGLTESDIVLLCTPDSSTRTPSTNEFNALQKKAYSAMAAIDADDLASVLDVLGVVTPNIGTMADLLNLKKILPESWISLTVQSTSELTTNPLASSILIFNTDGSINPVLEAASGLSAGQTPPTFTNSLAIALPGGCDELSKIIPPDQAISNKAFQAGLQNVGGISTTTLPRVATALLG